ncbi:MAG TPA: hypothetical protein VJ570_01610 [Holophagaceae bacterium]|nr:hypothetical protein [Holophagaceae bacterium]
MQTPPANLDVTHLRGRIAGLIRASVLATLREAQRTQLLAQAAEPLRTFVARAPEPDEWVPTPLLAEFLEITRKLSPLNTARSRAQLQADVSMEGTPSLQEAAPRDVVAQLPWFFSEVHRGGRVAVVSSGPDHAELLLEARYPYGDWYSDVLPMWLHRALVRAGAQEVQVRHLPPGADEAPWRHRYELAWKG